MTDFSEVEDNLEAWKEVHKQLMNAVLISKDAIAIQQAQRRFWLTELNANLTEDGKLTPNSVWKRPAKKRGRTKGSVAGTKRKKKTDDDDKPAKKRRTTKKKKEEQEAAAAAAASAVQRDDDDDEDDDDEEDEEEEDEEDHSKPKLHLSLHGMKQEDSDDDDDDDDDDETEDEDDEDEDDNNEESFLDHGRDNSAMAMDSGRLSPPEAPDPNSFSSFLPGQFHSFNTQTSRGSGMMAPTSFATAHAQDDSDEDTEEDDY